MTDLAIIAAISIFTAGITVSFGAIGPALGEGRAASTALSAHSTGFKASLRMLSGPCRKSILLISPPKSFA